MEELAEQGNIDASVAYFETFGFDQSVQILDVGTKFGSFLDRLTKRRYRNVAGIDTDLLAIETGRRTYPALTLLHSTEPAWPFDAGQFDVVTAFDVIEHVPDTSRFLREIRRVLRPGGTFVFQTPNLLINVPKEVIYTKHPLAWRSYHCSLQTLGSLRRLLENAEFKDIVIEKRPVCTEFNLDQSKRYLGHAGPIILRTLENLPLFLYPNFWGHAQNP